MKQKNEIDLNTVNCIPMKPEHQNIVENTVNIAQCPTILL